MPDLPYIAACGHVACLAASEPRHSRRSFGRWVSRERSAVAGRVGDLWALYERCRNG